MAHPRIVSHGAAARALERVRKLVLALPGAVEKEAWGRPTFRVGNRMFLMFADDHHGDGRLALWLQCTREEQEAAVEADPERCFVPPYVGVKGWLGLRLDRGLARPLVEAQVRAAWARAAPARVRARLDAPAPPPVGPTRARVRAARRPRRGA